MITPLLKWLKGPGFFIPVFFLPITGLNAQMIMADPAVLALGDSYLCMDPVGAAGLNPAALAGSERMEVQAGHSRPFLLGELGQSHLSLRIPAGRSGTGISADHCGIPGLSFSDLWFGAAIQVHPDLLAGSALLLSWSYSHEKGASLALGSSIGILWRFREEGALGIGLKHPLSWPGYHRREGRLPMILSAGSAWTFFRTATAHLQLDFSEADGLSAGLGIEIPLHDRLCLMMGWRSSPASLGAGFKIRLEALHMSLSTRFIPGAGSVPACSLSYAF